MSESAIPTGEERTLEKLSENHFRLTINDKENKTTTIKDFTKDELKEIYKEVNQNVENLNSMREQENHKAKMLTDLDDEEMQKIEDFIEMQEKAKNFSEAKKSKDAIPNYDKQIEFLENSKKEIERKIPEVKRN